MISNTTAAAVPRIIAFDLDGTLWCAWMSLACGRCHQLMNTAEARLQSRLQGALRRRVHSL
jgi:hypothetical protein